MYFEDIEEAEDGRDIGEAVPLVVRGFQYRFEQSTLPLWFILHGSTLGVHFRFGFDEDCWIASIVSLKLGGEAVGKGKVQCAGIDLEQEWS